MCACLRNSALHMAAMEGNEAIVKVLLAVPGIDTRIQNNYGQTASELAAKRKHSDITKLIEQHVPTSAPWKSPIPPMPPSPLSEPIPHGVTHFDRKVLNCIYPFKPFQGGYSFNVF